MTKHLKTEFKRIGRSGPTVDGRIIEPSALIQAAANYSKDLFTALIWPDHIRWFNMGTVEELRTETNDEGGIDLYAVIAPNDYYLENNRNGQRLFTSMELRPNFRDTGEYYLTGLAATDDPSSAATSEMRFTAGGDKTALLSQFTENIEQSFDDDQDKPPRWFENLFKLKPSEDDMDKKALEKLTEQFTAMQAQIDALKPTAASDDASDDGAQDYAALSDKVDSLLEKFETLEKGADKETVSAEKFNTLLEQFGTLKTAFDNAVSETGGTNAGEHDGETFKAADYQ